MENITLKQARLLAGLTQMQVAKKVRITPATLTNAEKRRHSLRADTFMALCKLYGCKCEQIKL